MILKFIKLTLTICSVLILNTVKSQDAQLSQYDNSQLLLNPSLAGATDGNIRVQLNNRNQWGSISAPFKTSVLSFDMRFKKKKKETGFLGLGFTLLSDKAGTSQLGLTQINLLVAYHARLSEYSNFSGGLIGGFAQRAMEYSKLQWNSQYDGNSFDQNRPTFEVPCSNKKTYLDFGGGLEWTHTKGEMYSTANNQLFINVGIAVFHVNKPNVSFYSSTSDNLPIKLIFHAKSQIGINNTKYSINPSIVYSQQNGMKNLVIGTLMKKKVIEESKYTGINKPASISIGGFYRFRDAIIPCVQFEYSNFAVALSYDVNISGLITATSGKGGFEISLRWVHDANKSKL